MGKLKDWLMQKFGDVPETDEGPSDYGYSRLEEPAPELPSFDVLMQRLNAERRDEKEVF
jgi:hypothetical protein